jgi:Thioredoxin
MEDLQATQFDNLVSSEERTLVMFYADWCSFCQQFKPPCVCVNKGRIGSRKDAKGNRLKEVRSRFYNKRNRI